MAKDVDHNQKQRKRTALIVAIGLHGLIAVLAVFMIAWREPDPPIPQYGVVLNFGLSTTGSGQQPVNEETIEEVAEEAKAEQEQEVTKEASSSQSQMSPSESAEKAPAYDDVHSPDQVTDESMEDTPGAPVGGKTETEEKEEEEKQEQKVANELDQYPTNSKQGSQGDDKEKSGDKGVSTGEIDAKSLYGAQGSGQGASLEMAGWVWDFKPEPDDESEESGKIVYQVKIDDRGELVSVKTIESTVSPAVERLYRQEVEKLTFSKTSDNTMPAPMSTGKITFIIKNR